MKMKDRVYLWRYDIASLMAFIALIAGAIFAFNTQYTEAILMLVAHSVFTTEARSMVIFKMLEDK